MTEAQKKPLDYVKRGISTIISKGGTDADIKEWVSANGYSEADFAGPQQSQGPRIPVEEAPQWWEKTAEGRQEMQRRAGGAGASTRPRDDAQGLASAPWRGLAKLFGAPVDIVNNVMGAFGAPVSDSPVGGYNWLKSGLDGEPTFVDVEPSNTVLRAIARGVEEATAAAAPMGVAMSMGRRAGPTAEAARELFAGKSAGERAAQLGISGASGLGAGTMAEIFPGSQTAEIAGSILGGGAGLLSNYAGGSIWNMAAPLVDDETRRQIAGAVLRRSALDPSSLTAIRPNILPGSALTTAQATMDPGLATLERGLRSEDMQQGSRFAMRDAERIEAQKQAMRRQAPVGAGRAGEVQGFFGSMRQGLQQQTESAINRAREAVTRGLQGLGQGRDSSAAGAVIRGAYDEGRDRASANVSRAYQHVTAQGDVTIPTQSIWDDAAAAANEAFAVRTNGTPAPLAAILDRLRAPNVDFNTLDSLAKEADNFASIAYNQGDRRAGSVAAQIAGRIRQGLDDAVEAGSASPEAAEAYTAARAARREMGERFERGPSGQVGKRKDYGEPAITESEIPAKFWNSSTGSADDAAQFIRTFGTRGAARDALTDYAINDLRRVAVNQDGTINPTAWRNWIMKHSGPLRHFPELRQRVENLAAAQDTLDDAVVGQRSTLDAIDRTAAGRMLDREAAEGINAIMLSPNREREIRLLLTAAGRDENRVAALRRAALDWIESRSTQQGHVTALGEHGLSAVAYKKALSAVRESWVRSGLFSAEHMRALTAIADDMTATQFAQQANRSVGSNTYQNMTTGNLLAQLTMGGAAPDNTLMTTLLRPVSWLYRIPDQKVRIILADAMLDPKLAAALARKATPENIQWVGRQLKRRLAATSLTTTGQLTGREDGKARAAENIR